MFGLIGVASSQLIIGIPPDSPMQGEVRQTISGMLNVLFIIGALFCLIGAGLHRDRDPRLSLRIGIAGQFSVFVGVACYTYIVLDTATPPYWLSWLSGALGFGITYASAHRLLQQWRALRDLKGLINVAQPESEDE